MIDDNETTEFILPEETNDFPKFEEETVLAENKFPVLPSLAVVTCILIALFSTVVAPKAFSLFDKSIQPPAEIVPLPDVASVSNSVDQFKNLSLQAKSVYVFDSTQQKVLFEKNGEEKWPLASITKLMTTLLSYELVPDDTVVRVSKAASRQESGGYFSEGEEFEVKKLADFALVSSFNSAAYTLADAVGSRLGSGDPVSQFVSAMNIRAEELGLTTMQFNNPTGLDLSATKAGSYGSAKDVSLLVDYIHHNYPEILLPTVTPHARLYNENGEYHDGDNTNDIITDIPNVLGSKTGYTDLAGGNLTIIFDAGYNHLIIITVLGSTLNGRFADMKKLITASLTTTDSK